MTDRREEPAPRRVEDVREEREADRAQRESELGTSWVSVIFGLLAALGAWLILSGIVSAIVGAILGTGSATQSAAEGGAASLIGLLITLLLAFLIGGYAAGRMASRSGVKHGLLVALSCVSAHHDSAGALGSGCGDRPHKLQWGDDA